MQIPLQNIHANPFRDFELHPIDQEQVERLKASIDADGFWASVMARKAADGYEIAFGHHRLEAARLLGLKEAPIEVRDLSDWQMVRMLASENATQRGSTAAACLDAVSAISRVLAYNLLRWDEATFAEISAKVPVDYPSCRGRLESGSGIGHDCIKAFAPNGAFSGPQIETALGILKDSGRMATIIAEASERAGAELRAEEEEAERELVAAQEREAKARTKADREAAAKETKTAKREVGTRKKSTASAGKASTAAEKKPIIFDARCAQLFRFDSHVATYRHTVTGDTFRSFLPLDRQFEFAKSVLATIRENEPNKKEITAADIRRECWARLESGVQIPKADLRTSSNRPSLDELKDGLNFLRRGFNDYRRGIALLRSALRKGEKLTAAQQKKLDEWLTEIESGLAIRSEYRAIQRLQIVGE